MTAQCRGAAQPWRCVQLSDACPLCRREIIEKQRAEALHWKLTQQGKTEQSQKDLERLTLIRQQREEANKKRCGDKGRAGAGLKRVAGCPSTRLAMDLSGSGCMSSLSDFAALLIWQG